MKSNREVDDLLAKGYIILSKDSQYVTLEQPKKFNWGWFLFWLILTFFGGFIYLIYFVGKQNKRVTVKNG